MDCQGAKNGLGSFEVSPRIRGLQMIESYNDTSPLRQSNELILSVNKFFKNKFSNVLN